MSWCFSDIGNHVDKISTWNPNQSLASCAFRYIDLSSVDKDKKVISLKDVPFINPVEAPSRARQIVKAKDVIVATVRPNLNGVAVVPDELEGATASTGYCVLRTDSSTLDFRYLYHWVKTNSFIEDMMKKATGASYPAVSDKVIKESKIPLPPLAEQKRIAAILDKADSLRCKNQQAIQLADQFLRAVFFDMFGDPVTNSKGWKEMTLSDVVKDGTIITYGIVQAGPEVENGIPYIRTGDFKNGQLVKSGYAKTHPDLAAKFERSKVSTGDLVYCIRASIGSVDIVPKFLNGANLTQGTAKISPGSNIKAEFLVEFLRSKGFRDWIDRYSKGATFKEITLERLRAAPVLVPPLHIQEEFIAIRTITLHAIQRKTNMTEMPLFESLSQKAFAGEL